MDRFVSHYALRLDAKGRVSIPASFRAVLARDGFEGLYCYPTLDRPALVLWGSDDAYLPWQLAERQREAFPSARVEALDGLGHWPFHEDPARVAELVLPFLAAQTA